MIFKFLIVPGKYVLRNCWKINCNPSFNTNLSYLIDFSLYQFHWLSKDFNHPFCTKIGALNIYIYIISFVQYYKYFSLMIHVLSGICGASTYSLVFASAIAAKLDLILSAGKKEDGREGSIEREKEN